MPKKRFSAEQIGDEENRLLNWSINILIWHKAVHNSELCIDHIQSRYFPIGRRQIAKPRHHYGCLC